MSLELMERIVTEAGISSFEEGVSKIVAEEYEKLGLAVSYDGLGSVTGFNGIGNELKFMIAAHMDEVGFMVKEIDDNGFIFFQTIGSWWSHMVLGQWYEIVNREGRHYKALMGSMATHGLPQDIRNKTVDITKCYLDLGVNSKEDVLKLGIDIGDMVIPMPVFKTMNDPEYICSKAFDDRIGTYIMLEVARRMKDSKKNSVYYANTVQEEPGLRGARTATFMVHPDIAFAIDTTLAGDTPMNKNICSLGKGVVLSMIDSNSIAPRKLVRYVEDICIRNNINYQYAVFNKGGTDSGNIHKTFEGIVNMTLSIPIRYMHTNHSIIHLGDVEGCIDLLCALIEDIDKNKFEELL